MGHGRGSPERSETASICGDGMSGAKIDRSEGHLGEETGEKNPPSSTPETQAGARAVGKLDTGVFKPFGVANISLSRGSSNTSDSNSEGAICRGGPNNSNCGVQVVDGDKAVECCRCQQWFHSKCQAIPKLAYDALTKYKCLTWLCEKCKKIISDVESNPPTPKDDTDLASLEGKVQNIGEMVRDHMKIIVQSMKEQEKVVSDSAKLLERICKDQHNQKATYADMVRGTCDKVVKEVSAKIETLPAKVGVKDSSEATRAMSNVFDSFMDREKRKLNVVVHNLPEDDSETLAERTIRDQEIFKDVIKAGMNLNIHPTRSFRVGKKLDDRPRLLIVTLDSAETKIELLKMAPQLRYLTTWKRIYVTPDLSKKEREEGKRLREELAARRQTGETNLVIKRGRIVTVPDEMSGATSSLMKGAAEYNRSKASKGVTSGKPHPSVEVSRSSAVLDAPITASPKPTQTGADLDASESSAHNPRSQD